MSEFSMELLAFLNNLSFLKVFKTGQPIRIVHKDHVT